MEIDMHGDTELKVEKITFKWIIKNFSFANKEYSSPEFFSEAYSSFKWRLSMQHDTSKNGFIHLRISCTGNEVFGKYKLYTINNLGEYVLIANSIENFISRVPVIYTVFLDSITIGKVSTVICEMTFPVVYISSLAKSKDIFKKPEWKQNAILENLFENKKFSDVTLAAGSKEFPVHKCILASSSSVFAAMFESGMTESKLNRVTITDIDPEVLEEVLRYIYTSKTPNLKTMAANLLATADKYALDTLKVMCEEALYNQLSVETASEILKLAEFYNANQLKEKTIQFMNTHDLVTNEQLKPQ